MFGRKKVGQMGHNSSNNYFSPPLAEETPMQKVMSDLDGSHRAQSLCSAEDATFNVEQEMMLNGQLQGMQGQQVGPTSSAVHTVVG
jgi:hypothetical protein